MKVPKPITTQAGEASSIAAELVRAYQEMVTFYRDQLDLSDADADQRARGLEATPDEAAQDMARIAARPPDQVSWFDLTRLVERDPQAMDKVWSGIKAQARQELASGHRTVNALEWQSRPWDRARFLAIRDSFRAKTPPQTGIEAALLDSAAEAFSDYLSWSEHLHMQTSAEVESQRQRLERDGGWSPPRRSIAEAIEQSAKMAERSHTRFLRTIKQLHELRRMTPTVVVGHAGQINLGSQQINLSADPSGASFSDREAGSATRSLDDFDKSCRGD